MKLLNEIIFLFAIVEVRSQIDVLQIGEDVLTGDSDRGNIVDDATDFNISEEIDDNLPSVDYFIEDGSHHIWGQEDEDDTLGAAHADPTLHKWKHKLPVIHSHIHSHIHSISHGNPHGIETSVVYPVGHQISHQAQSVHSQNKQFSTFKGHGIETPVLVYPVDHQFSHQSQNGHSLNNQFSLHKGQGVDSIYPSGKPNANHWDKGFQQTAHSTYNQNFNNLINNQNVHLSNQNSHLENFDASGKVIYPSDTFNPGVVNINGQSNTVIQSGTSQKYISSQNGQVFFHEKAAQPSSDDHIIGISMPVEEQSHWQNNPQVSEQMNSAQIEAPAVYDSEMNNILDILDERSYQLTRPEIEPSGKLKNAEAENSLQVIRNPADGQVDEESNFNYNGRNQQEEGHYLPVPESGGDLDYILGSPSLIQIPWNNHLHYYTYNRNSRSKRSPTPRDINMNVLSDNSIFFNISSWRLKEMNSKLNDTLHDYQNVVDGYRKKVTDRRESLFVDLLDSIIGQFQMKEYTNSNEIKKIQKRAATITKLLNDPDARLDVPKTLDNIGVITRNAFEDERSPMYHVRQFIGSTKNAVFSAMKIPPQNLVIPSNYEIKNINPEEISELEDNMVSGINPKILSRSGFENIESIENNGDPYPNDPYGIVETFARVGGAIRDSVRSGQNTLNHISDIAHNARKIYQTTKNTMPRVLLPYAKAPVLKSRFKETKTTPLKKAIVISPKVLAVRDPMLGASKVEQDFISMGNILDAIGLTKPNKDQIDLEKIVFKMPGQGETRGIYIPPIGEVKSLNGRILPNSKYGNEKTREITKKQFGRMQENVASVNKVVKEGIGKMKNDISKALHETKNIINEKKSDILQMKERNNIDKDRDILPQSVIQADKSKVKGKKNEIKHFTKEEENEIIDKFLYNIFKIDGKPEERSESVILLNKIKKKGKNYDETTINSKKNEKGGTDSILRLKNNISFSDILPNITDSLLQETIKNITLDLLKDEKENSSKMKKYKSNKIHKENLNRKNKVSPMKRPKIVLRSRFGDDEESYTATRSPNNLTVLEFKGLDEDKEAMRKVDQYVLNDVAAPMLLASSNNEKVKNFFKVGNVLIEDPSEEESSNEFRSEEYREEEKAPAFSSRNLLWFPGVEENQEGTMLNPPDPVEKLSSEKSEENNGNKETVGLNQPPEFMTPFMSRASNNNIERVQGNIEDVNRRRSNLPSGVAVGSSQSEISHFTSNERKGKSSDEDTDGGDIVGLNLPPELMKPFMARGSDADIENTFTSDEGNEYNAIINDNNEMQNYLPLLMMPLRTTKSVKKTLDEFLKKENETTQESSEDQENRLKNSGPENTSRSFEGVVQPVQEHLYTYPPSPFLKGMVSGFSKEDNCKLKKCYQSPTSVQTNYDGRVHCSDDSHNPHLVPHFDYNERNVPQNVIVCVSITGDSDGPIQHTNQSPEHYRHSVNEEIDASRPETAKKDVGEARTSMAVNENLRKPFMGLGNGDTIKKFYAEYNGKQEDGGDLFDSDEEQLLFNDE